MLDESIERSVAVIAEYQQPSGAYPASPNFKSYQYTWFRDGSFVADGMSRTGQVESAEKFFAWGAKIITDRRKLIMSGGKLDARYTYDGKEAQEEWGNFQLDGYGVFLWALKGHTERHGKPISEYKEVVELLQHYLVTNWQEPCFDWWEERLGVHAATLACVYAGLNAFDNPEAAIVKNAIDLTNERADASLIVCALFDAVNETDFSLHLEKIEEQLVSRDGGVHRYQDDVYFGGGEWPVLSALLGWYYLKLGRTAAARALLSWCANQADGKSWIPEQSQAHMLHPDEYEGWVKKLGKPAHPLLWSHAMVLTLASELIDTM